MGQWSDLPRRLATVSIGAPLIVLILSHRASCIIFWQIVHILCALEWIRLTPATVESSEDDEYVHVSLTNSNDQGIASATAPKSPVELRRRATPTRTTNTADSKDETSQKSKSSPDSINTQLKRPISVKVFPILSPLLAMAPHESITFYLSLSSAFLYLSYYMDMSTFTTSSKGTTIITSKQETRKRHEYIQSSCQHCLFGLFYLSLSFHHWIQIANLSFSHTVYLLFIVWNCDTGALVAGRVGKMMFQNRDILKDILLGNTASATTTDTATKDLEGSSWRHQFVNVIKCISPSKSLTGFGGGVVFGMVTAVYLPTFMVWMARNVPTSSIFQTVFIPSWKLLASFLSALRIGGDEVGCAMESLTSQQCHMDVHLIQEGSLMDFDTAIVPIGSTLLRRCLLGFILSLFAIGGDLVESAVKRRAGKKDSGKLLPGHGGLLDRFDSTFLSAGIHFFIISKQV